MIRSALVLLLSLSPVYAGQIDYLGAFPSEAAAKADAAWGRYWTPPTVDSPGTWRPDICIPSLFVWAPAQDVSGTAPDGSAFVTHTPYDALWRISCSFQADNVVLDASPATHLVTDRDAANAGLPFVRQSALPDALLNSLMLSPLYAGSNYPFGATR